jgi:ABC-type lipoprotein release transport system permease subunit
MFMYYDLVGAVLGVVLGVTAISHLCPLRCPVPGLVFFVFSDAM